MKNEIRYYESIVLIMSFVIAILFGILTYTTIRIEKLHAIEERLHECEMENQLLRTPPPM